ncbi:MAG: CBS domain-containing protein [Saprospirales bacterium]|jgi:acetoin utilization protein AcuB|nr:CBS domain-containing protein [Saprospirales bacterium]MBK7335467.1 CBS domain-containing protein [Saprospirales bacterium]
MIAEKLISKNTVPLHVSDTGEEALGMMNDFRVRHLPVVDHQQLLGILSEEDVLENDVEEVVGSYPLRFVKNYVHSSDHLYEVLRVIGINQTTTIPVLDSEERYIGLITLEDLLQALAHFTSFAEPGGVLVLEMARHDYSMAEITRIVEAENTLILSSFVSSEQDSPMVELTLKLNKQDLQRVVAALSRYGFDVKGSFTEQDYDDSLKERYDLLMAYLNV